MDLVACGLEGKVPRREANAQERWCVVARGVHDRSPRPRRHFVLVTQSRRPPHERLTPLPQAAPWSTRSLATSTGAGAAAGARRRRRARRRWGVCGGACVSPVCH